MRTMSILQKTESCKEYVDPECQKYSGFDERAVRSVYQNIPDTVGFRVNVGVKS